MNERRTNYEGKPNSSYTITASRSSKTMIKSFSNKETENLFSGIGSKKLPQEIQRPALRKLIILNAAASIRDLELPPGNRLEKLHDNSLPEWSIRINDQWRIVFNFENGDAYQVKIIDYH